MKEGYHLAEYSPNLFGGNKHPFHPWCRVAHRHPAGQVTPILDFILDAKLAHDMARQKDIDWRTGKGATQ